MFLPVYHLTVVIPTEESTEDARRQFADPIDRALATAGRLGRVTDVTGWFNSRDSPTTRRPPQVCLRLDVTDRKLAARLILAELTAADAPAGSRVGDFLSDTILARVTAAGPELLARPGDRLPVPGPRLPWQEGEVLGYRPTANHWTLLTVRYNRSTFVWLSVADWCGPDLPPAGAVADLVHRRPTRSACTGHYILEYRRVQSDGVTVDPPPLPSGRRFARTGVTVPDRPYTSGGMFLMGVTPRELARTLREAFGLVPADPLTRLHHDHGVGWSDRPRPVLAVWDAGRRVVTPADFRRLVVAQARGDWAADLDPLPLPTLSTPRSRRFADRLIAWDRQTDRWSVGWTPHPHAAQPVGDRLRRVGTLWGGGRPLTAGGFAALTMEPHEFPAAAHAAAEIGRACGVTVYDPQDHRLIS